MTFELLLGVPAFYAEGDDEASGSLVRAYALPCAALRLRQRRRSPGGHTAALLSALTGADERMA